MEVHQPIVFSIEPAPIIYIYDPDDSESIVPENSHGRGDDARDNSISGEADGATQSGDGAGGKNDDEGEKVGDEGEDQEEYGWSLPECIAASANNTLQDIEVELGVTSRLLRNNIELLSCSGKFEGFDKPGAAETLARINSLVSNKHVDVHFSYHSDEWFTIGFKISHGKTPPSQMHTATLKMLHDRPITHKYGTQGWRSIVYAFYDDYIDEYGDSWPCIEIFSFDMDMGGLIDVHEALWGPLAELPRDASEEAQVGRRETLIQALRVLLAAVGIEYYISCRDVEADFTPRWHTNYTGQIMWMLEGVDDRWLARGARAACGFQLQRDPEEEEKGREARQEQVHGYEDDQSGASTPLPDCGGAVVFEPRY